MEVWGTDANPHASERLDFNPKGTLLHTKKKGAMPHVHVQLQLSNHLEQKKCWRLALRLQNSCQRGFVRTDLQGVSCAKNVVVSQAVRVRVASSDGTQNVIIPEVGGPTMSAGLRTVR